MSVYLWLVLIVLLITILAGSVMAILNCLQNDKEADLNKGEAPAAGQEEAKNDKENPPAEQTA